MKVGVVGLVDGWSTLALADVIEQRTGFRLVVDMSEVICDLSRDRVMYRDTNLCSLDGLIIKKIGNARCAC